MNYARFRLWLWDRCGIRPPLSREVIGLIYRDNNRQTVAFEAACAKMGHAYLRSARQILAFGETFKQRTFFDQPK